MELDLEWEPGARIVRWTVDGRRISIDHESPVNSAVALQSPPSIVIVEKPDHLPCMDNAVVYEVDGTERLRLTPPSLQDGLCFDQVFSSRGKLVAVFATRHGDWQGEPDLLTGSLQNLREWR